MKIISWEKYDPDKYEGFEGTEKALADEEVVKEIKKNRYLFDGEYHQYGEHGAPVFDNGKQFVTTMRSWGEIMKECYPDLLESYIEMAWGWYNGQIKDKIKYPEGRKRE